MSRHPKSILFLLLAICVLFSATLGYVAPLCSALAQVQIAEDCHLVHAEGCHGADCKAHSPAGTTAHGCCLNLLALLPSLRTTSMLDEHQQAVPFLALLSPQSRAERLFRPPRAVS